MRHLHLPRRSGARSRPATGQPRRTRREWAADLGLFLFAACFALASSSAVPVPEGRGPVAEVADQLAGGVACAAVFLRRRWPVALAVALLLGGKFGHYLAGPAMVALYTVAATRPGRTTAWVAALALAPGPYFLLVQAPHMGEAQIGSAATYFALMAGSIGWGLFQRSRQQLVDSLRERAERAESEAALRAERARRQAREEIAREMHDVLAHRLSLLSVHAGALEFHPSAGPEEVGRAAGVIRDSAHQALQELREIIGVLRAPVDENRPQPTARDVDALVREVRDAGTRVDYLPLPAEVAEAVPEALGRTAYRIVQEGLTNARKHAPGRPVRVALSVGPGAQHRAERELRIALRNPLPHPVSGPLPQPSTHPSTDRASGGGQPPRLPTEQPPGPTIPGAGQGLIGLTERATLAGGHLGYGPDAADFRLVAWLPWPAAREAPDD